MEQADKKKTFEDLVRVSGEESAELIDGEIIMMAPASAIHSAIQSNILTLSKSASLTDTHPKGPEGLFILCEAWTYYDQHNSFVHDIAAFEKAKLKSIPKKGPIKTTPFWVAEVLSPSNWISDTQLKRVVLEKYGIPYYWVVNPVEKNLMIFHQSQPQQNYQLVVSAAMGADNVELPPFSDLRVSDVFTF